MPRLSSPITAPAALVLAAALACALFPAATLAVDSDADRPGTFTLVESWPEYTQLDLSAIPDAPEVWARVMGGAAAKLDLAGFYFSRKGDGKDAGGPAGAPDLLLPVLALLAFNAVGLYRQALRAADTAYDRTLLASAKAIGEELQISGSGDAARVLATVPYSALEAFEADNRSRMFFKVSGFQVAPAEL